MDPDATRPERTSEQVRDEAHLLDIAELLASLVGLAAAAMQVVATVVERQRFGAISTIALIAMVGFATFAAVRVHVLRRNARARGLHS